MTAAQELVRQAPPAGFYIGVLFTILVVLAWWRYMHMRFAKCKCDRKPTLLRPKWKKVDPRDDIDRYEEDE